MNCNPRSNALGSNLNNARSRPYSIWAVKNTCINKIVCLLAIYIYVCTDEECSSYFLSVRTSQSLLYLPNCTPSRKATNIPQGMLPMCIMACKALREAVKHPLNLI